MLLPEYNEEKELEGDISQIQIENGEKMSVFMNMVKALLLLEPDT